MLPEPTTVVLSPPPTPNGPLHLGHLAGPYVAADVAARALRLRGERVLSVCGLDDHQNYVIARARQEGTEAGPLRDHYAGLIRGVFDRLRVTHDVFVEPLAAPAYRATVARFLGELVDTGAVPVEEWVAPACPSCPGTLHHAYVSGQCACCGAGSGGGTCEGCGSYTPAAELASPACTRCGRAATAFRRTTGPVLRLEDHREALEAFWCRAALPGRVRAMISRLRAGPLPVVPLAYETDWGIEYPGGHRIDVWAEMGLGYLYSIGRTFTPRSASLADHVTAWRSVGAVWAFMGLDNAFYYSALFPALYAAAGLSLDPLAGLVVNEFYRLSGAKFSTSRDHAVWAHEFLTGNDPADVRMFLSWDRPSPEPTDFTEERFHAAVAAWRETMGLVETSPADLRRAEASLLPGHFDAALATRCLLTADPAEATTLLRAVTGEG